MLDMLNNLTNKVIEIGGYTLPADFKYLEKDFLISLINKDFAFKVKSVYSKVSLREFSFDLDIEALQIFSLDDSLCGVDFSTLSNASYLDFIFDKSDLFGQVCSVISLVTASYLDLVEGEVIGLFEEVNFAVPSCDGVLALAVYVAKKIGLPIGALIIGGEKPVDFTVTSVYYSSFTPNEIDDIIDVFYDEFDMVIDPISALAISSMDGYYDKYEDDNLCVFLTVTSPYLFSRRLLKIVTGKGELDVKRAIQKLYFETSLEIPSSIENGKIPSYYVSSELLPFSESISFIKKLSKV